ncbi:Biopolymer transport protein ExbD [bacterium HR39]|nr:Biopolymer transport protein ExbD [bacterium HR39]
MAGGIHHGGGVRRRSRRMRRQMAEINVTPFVDVMLVLLVVFMVTAPLMVSGVPVELPRADGAAVPNAEEPLVITVTREGAVYAGKEPLPRGDLAVAFAALAGEDRGRRVYVRADRDVDYGTVMEVMAALRGAGLTRIALLTRPPHTETARLVEPAAAAR